MATVYILYSKFIDKYYIGSCKDFSVRYEEHLYKVNSNSFTSRADDWTLFYKIDNLEYQQSRKIEQHIKKMKSRVFIENLSKYPQISIKLIQKYK